MVRRTNTNVWTKLVNIASPSMTAGMAKGTSMKSISTTRSSPLIFPNRRSERDTGRAMCPITSIKNIIGASHRTGPMKCFM